MILPHSWTLSLGLLLLCWAAVSNTLATSPMWPFKFKYGSIKVKIKLKHHFLSHTGHSTSARKLSMICVYPNGLQRTLPWFQKVLLDRVSKEHPMSRRGKQSRIHCVNNSVKIWRKNKTKNNNQQTTKTFLVLLLYVPGLSFFIQWAAVLTISRWDSWNQRWSNLFLANGQYVGDL